MKSRKTNWPNKMVKPGMIQTKGKPKDPDNKNQKRDGGDSKQSEC